MNESELEKQLRALRPVSPTQGLEGRVAKELTPVSEVRPRSAGVIEKKSWLEKILPAVGWSAAGAAIGVVVMLSLNLAGGGRQQTISTTQPADTAATTDNDRDVEEQVVTMQDEGIVSSPSGPARVVRYTSLERRSWKDATSGATTFVEVPREDVVLLPVNIQ